VKISRILFMVLWVENFSQYSFWEFRKKVPQFSKAKESFSLSASGFALSKM
jgi:hypothetical protein